MIYLKDNSCNKIIEKQHLERLKPFSCKSIGKLLEDNTSLFFVSPQLNNEDFYKIPLWQIYDDKVYTNNIMGFIGLPDDNVRISSRFTNDSQKDYFLHYMLQKVFLGQVINLDISASEEDKIWEFFYYLFPYYLQKALSIGIYKEYVHKKYNNMNVRGSINIKRHLQKNIPFQGKIAYHTREHSYNNKIIQLIRHTIEHIKTYSFGHAILNCNLAVRESVEQIEYLTPDYYCANRTYVIASCYDMVNNPYWAYYETLRKLCLKILHRDSLALSGSEEKIHGILFDGAWLWEEYLATILPKDRFIHPNNITRKTPIHLDEENRLKRYPDFYTKDKEIVLDAKYKAITKNPPREDIHQIVTYMYTLKAQLGILVYPAEESKRVRIYSLKGYGGKLCQHSFGIATDNGISFGEFSKKMGHREKEFLEQL